MQKKDTVGQEYYSPLKKAELVSDTLFWVSALLSLIVLFVEPQKNPKAFAASQTAFCLAVLGVFVSGIAIQIYWSSRAQDKRIADLLSHAFQVPLIAEPSKGYYNNNATDPVVRLAANVLENTLFTKTILIKMLRWERIKVAAYTIVWLIAMLNRATDFQIITAVAQVIFSEQVIARWLRMEWLRSQVENIHDGLYSTIQSAPAINTRESRARVMEACIRYESAKGQAKIALSSAIFEKINPSVSSQWRQLSKQLKLDQQ
ncbi:hypothetical protein NIBR502774_14130 (plasmid) [Rhizobium sp. NIBRBAC000502774]|uniref:hypothetical protein n=1 Tax=Rhizobium leguminosarum TaxID=384 RepID=UPI0011403440|nr:hypothetical protein NIBR502774_14130 [Rhizobium sp. NIBRBAC000502774]